VAVGGRHRRDVVDIAGEGTIAGANIEAEVIQAKRCK
jgi:hypothetical protein